MKRCDALKLVIKVLSQYGMWFSSNYCPGSSYILFLVCLIHLLCNKAPCIFIVPLNGEGNQATHNTDYMRMESLVTGLAGFPVLSVQRNISYCNPSDFVCTILFSSVVFNLHGFYAPFS